MAARKAWKDLSPDYRRRLERRGITAASHRNGSLKAVRGHGIHTPSGRREAAQRQQRVAQRRGMRGYTAEELSRITRELESRENRLGYLPASQIREWSQRFGVDNVALLLEWQEGRTRAFQELESSNPTTSRGRANKRRLLGHSIFGANGMKHRIPGTFGRDYPTFEQFVKTNYGDDRWNDTMEEWWEDAKDIIALGYYH